MEFDSPYGLIRQAAKSLQGAFFFFRHLPGVMIFQFHLWSSLGLMIFQIHLLPDTASSKEFAKNLTHHISGVMIFHFRLLSSPWHTPNGERKAGTKTGEVCTVCCAR